MCKAETISLLLPFPLDNHLQLPAGTNTRGWWTSALVQEVTWRFLLCMPTGLQKIKRTQVRGCLKTERKPRLKQWLLWEVELELMGCGSVHVHTCGCECICVNVCVRTWYVPIRPGSMHIFNAHIYKCWTIHLGHRYWWVLWKDCWLLRHSDISENVETSETSVLPGQWVCSDFCGQCSNICFNLSAQGMWYHKSSVSEDKCLIATVVPVAILALIPFCLAYHLLFAIDYSKLEILALLWEVMKPTRACGIKSTIAGSRTNYYLHNQILNWCFSLRLQSIIYAFLPLCKWGEEVNFQSHFWLHGEVWASIARPACR